MFWHEFVYEIRRLLRQKEELFWMLMFPVILGTLFYFAFGSINNTTENFHTIPVAVCRENGQPGFYGYAYGSLRGNLSAVF